MPDLVVGAIARAFHTLETIASVNLGLLFVLLRRDPVASSHRQR
jgi:hypothetical protein